MGDIVLALVRVPVPFNKTQLRDEKFCAVASIIVIPFSQIPNGPPALASALETIDRLMESFELTVQLLLAVTVNVKSMGEPKIISNGPGIYTGFKIVLLVKVPSPEVVQEYVAALITLTPTTRLKITVSSSQIVLSFPKSTRGTGSIKTVMVLCAASLQGNDALAVIVNRIGTAFKISFGPGT